MGESQGGEYRQTKLRSHFVLQHHHCQARRASVWADRHRRTCARRGCPVDTEEQRSSSVDVDADEVTNQIPPEEMAGLLAGRKPQSRLFPFQVDAAIWEKSSELQKPWSISELGLSRSDRMAIREWGKHGVWDMRREM